MVVDLSVGEELQIALIEGSVNFFILLSTVKSWHLASIDDKSDDKYKIWKVISKHILITMTKKKNWNDRRKFCREFSHFFTVSKLNSPIGEGVCKAPLPLGIRSHPLP